MPQTSAASVRSPPSPSLQLLRARLTPACSFSASIVSPPSAHFPATPLSSSPPAHHASRPSDQLPPHSRTPPALPIGPLNALPSSAQTCRLRRAQPAESHE